MRTLIITVVSLGMLLNSTIATSSNDTVPYYMFEAASAFKLDVAFLYAFCMVESRCKASAINRDDGNKSQKSRGVKLHSHGLFQIQLPTARGVGFKGKKKDLMKPEINTYYAAKLIRTLLDKYHDPVKVISAYNAGRPITGNKNYVHMVMKHYIRFQMEGRVVK